MAGKDKNLNELLEKFMDAEQARQAARDIRQADQLFTQSPAPAPDDELIANIKTQVNEKLRQKPNAFKQITYKALAAAAAVIIITAVIINSFEKQSPQPLQNIVYASMLPQSIWDSNDVTVDDQSLATLAAEIEQIESEMLALQLNENGDSIAEEIEELEMELIEINTNFWKG